MLSVLAQLRIEKMTEWLAKRSVQPAFFNLVDLLCDAAQQSVVDKPVGYMAFETMVHAGVFERGFAQRGVECVPIEAPVRILTTVGIETFIKHGQREQAADYFIKMMRFLVKRGARSIVLGSVTIPLVVSDEQLMEIGVPIVNPFRVAAEAILLRQNEMDEKMTSSVIVEPATAAFQSC
jgi:aspartate/glutamate racemase